MDIGITKFIGFGTQGFEDLEIKGLVLEIYRLGIWKFGDLGIQVYMNLGLYIFMNSETKKIQGFRDFGLWGFGNLGTQRFRVLGIKRHSQSGIWD